MQMQCKGLRDANHYWYNSFQCVLCCKASMQVKLEIPLVTYSTPSRLPTTLFTLVNTSSHSPSLSDNQVMAPPAPMLRSAHELSSLCFSRNSMNRRT